MGINISTTGYGQDPIIRTYTASSTWFKPTTPSFYGAFVGCIGAGGGGGSGAVGSASASQLYGNSGGGGAVIWSFMPRDILPSSASITVGSGGSSGSRTATTYGNGVSGGAGGRTTFSYFVTASGAAQGAAGAQNGSGGGQSGFQAGYVVTSFPQYFPNAMGGGPSSGYGQGTPPAGDDGGTDSWGTPSGGSGGIISASVIRNGGRGGRMYNLGVISTTPSGGIGNTGQNGDDGQYSYNTNWFMDPTVSLPLGPGSAGGGGGAGDLDGTVPGGKGGNGGIGAGGGTGGSSRVGSRAGDGGKGGDGLCVVIEIYG